MQSRHLVTDLVCIMPGIAKSFQVSPIAKPVKPQCLATSGEAPDTGKAMFFTPALRSGNAQDAVIYDGSHLWCKTNLWKFTWVSLDRHGDTQIVFSQPLSCNLAISSLIWYASCLVSPNTFRYRRSLNQPGDRTETFKGMPLRAINATGHIYIEGARSSIAFSGTYADPSKIILLVTPRLRERQPTSKLPTHQKNSLRGSLRGQSCESWRSQTGPPRTQGYWEFSDDVNYNRKAIVVP
jgi:hypothetical protein